MKRVFTVMAGLLLTGCASLTPQPAPPPGAEPQEINRAQSLTLQKIGNVSAIVRGSPDDAARAIAAKARAQGASWYRIVALDDEMLTGVWRADAVLYGPAASAANGK
ncbi:biofilm peroxide resistance protein BsmA [Pantoea sp. 1.19]|uniref:biofilm peroxide resistance protein BsmA n=1 Tax=Pantoea sp. 1.19 TaxID=1925589 RepID=UPI000948ADE9|nr:biofilm peroxide resistance protein BsmA [Pantoea sp. 1.19]